MTNITEVASPLKLAGGIQWVITLALMLLIAYYLINIGNRYIERKNRISINYNLIFRVLFVVALILLAIYFIRKYPIIQTVISCAIIAAVVAFIINPLVDKLEEKGFKRNAGVIIVYISLLLIIIMLILVIIPGMVKEISNLIYELPTYASQWSSIFNNYFNDIADSLEELTGVDIVVSFNQTLRDITRRITNYLSGGLSKTTTVVASFVSNVVQVIARIALIFIMAYYFSVDKRMYIGRIKSLIPEKIEDDFYDLSGRILIILEEFVRGRALMAVFVGVLTTILLLILRVDFAFVIGIITAIADIIPYIGPFLAFIPAFFLAAIQSPIKGIIVAVFFFLIQWAENNILGPKILGESMDMNPLFILVSIVIGGGMFGVWGMIVSVPLFAIIIVIIKFIIEKIRERREGLSEEDSYNN